MLHLVAFLRGAITWTILWLFISFLLHFLHPHWLFCARPVLPTLALMSCLRVVVLLHKLILKQPTSRFHQDDFPSGPSSDQCQGAAQT